MDINRDISPMIHAAIAMIEKVAGVESVELLSTEMYRSSDPNFCSADPYSLGALGVDIIICDELSQTFETFLPHEMCEDMIAYPTGIFCTQEFVDAVIHPKDDTKLFEDKSDDHMLGDKGIILPVPQTHLQHTPVPA